MTGADASLPPLTAVTSPERPGAVHATPDTGSLAHGTGQPVSQRRRARASTQPHESLGRVLGNYRLHELIGRGGMGWVYRAEHIKLGREVALKLLKPEYASRRDSVARFFQEARAVNKIRHRNIVDITDFVELEDGTVFIIMELLRGQPLSRLARTGSIDPPRSLAILVQICDALGAAHEVGIVHRDMKPDNVFVADPGDGSDVIKLLDFGVAKLINQDEDTGWQTKAGSVIGTPAYMSPEQAGGLQVDGRSDCYSVGAIMYELFTGEPMFRAKSFGEYVRLHLNEVPTPPSRTAGGARMDDRLERIIMRCVSKSPDARYQTMRDLQRAVLELLGAIETGMMSPSSLAPGPVAGPAIHPGTGSGVRSQARHGPPTVPPTRRYEPERASRAPLFVAGALVLGAAAGLAFFLAANGGDDSTRPAPAAPAPGASAARATPARPVVSAIEHAPGGETADLITVRFTSDPSGAAVVPAGAASSLCRTPCDVSIDPSDGGSLSRRHFELRRRGYRAREVVIPLSAPPDQRHIVLARAGSDRAEDPDPDPGPSPDPVPDPEPDPEPQEEPERAPPDRIDPEDTLDPFER